MKNVYTAQLNAQMSPLVIARTPALVLIAGGQNRMEWGGGSAMLTDVQVMVQQEFDLESALTIGEPFLLRSSFKHSLLHTNQEGVSLLARLILLQAFVCTGYGAAV